MSVRTLLLPSSKGSKKWKVGCFIEKNILVRIRKDIEKCIGKTVILKANKGRKKTVVREGILEAAYPNLFIVKINNDYDSPRKVSYTYSDVLTGTVEVTVCSQSEPEEKIS
ncbi:MAG: Veg protein [Tissierellia bacterium]|nr:Veg protein [Tissierellia bacterium]